MALPPRRGYTLHFMRDADPILDKVPSPAVFLEPKPEFLPLPAMIRPFTAELESACLDFLNGCSAADYGQDPGWLKVIRETYGKEAGALVAIDDGSSTVRGIARSW
jgi:hypothetical protein